MELICKHEDDILFVDESSFIDDYLDWCDSNKVYENRKDENQMKKFINDFYNGLDDCYYYCDNAEENMEQLLNILISSKNIRNIKLIKLEY